MMLKIDIQYLTDKDGNKTAVIIPINDWVNISNDLTEFIEYQKIKKNLSTAFKEVVDIKNNKKEKVSLTEFLNEL